MARFTFQIGDHGIAEKRGHCTACSALQATFTVEAGDEKEAVEVANAFASKGLTATFQGKVTKRQLVKRGR